MRWVLLLCLVGGISCHSTDVKAEGGQEKGIVDWINSWLSSTTSTTETPAMAPMVECPTCQCGFTRTRRRIVGGYETKKKEIPWIAVLMYNGRFYCGGSLINDLYVLTAAHCTSGFRKEKMSVRFLEHDRSMHNETKTIDRKVSQIIRHLRYNPGTYDNDIAMLKLSERVDLSTALKRVRVDEVDEDNDIGLRPVCLPKPGLNYANETAIVAGWGTTEEGGSVSNTLQEVEVPIMTNMECRQTSYKNRITENMLCAGEKQGGHDACQGDSGGPLHVRDANTEKHHIVGVVSWGEGCARPDRPGVYSRVNRYLTWIKSNTRDACYCD
ncbi:trypsin-1-like [Maniola jurtina]|uniref:trypsin-1-like n=1 Tax=Maniola jurtina TaxID=191418 RepID=UPI001E687FEE|nr:trypsin-1-like [Maniola jurtina]XP_045767981.1 trypsin-1-like [Maniola jurtina]